MPLCPPQPVKWYLVFPRSLHWMHGQRLHCLKLPLQQLVLLYTFFSVVTMQCPLVRMNCPAIHVLKQGNTMHVISLKDAPIAVPSQQNPSRSKFSIKLIPFPFYLIKMMSNQLSWECLFAKAKQVSACFTSLWGLLVVEFATIMRVDCDIFLVYSNP